MKLIPAGLDRAGGSTQVSPAACAFFVVLAEGGCGDWVRAESPEKGETKEACASETEEEHSSQNLEDRDGLEESREEVRRHGSC